MSSIAETMTLKIIKQTIAELQKNGALAMTPEECLAMFTKSAPQKKRVTLMGGYKKKKAAAAKKARKAMDKTATLILKADEKVKKQEAKEAKKELADRAALIKLKSKAGREIIQAGKVAKKKAAAELKAKKEAEKLAKQQEREAKKQAAAELKAQKAEAKKRARLLKQLAKFAESEKDLMEEMGGRSIAKLESYLASNLKIAAEEKERKAALKALKAQNPRPKGRAPKGKTWCYETGEWIAVLAHCHIPDVDEEVETVMLC